MKRIALLVLASLFSVIMYAQTTVTGVVTGIDDEQPVPFANILIKGTTQGTFTDANGAYSINCNQDAVLIVSAIGYSTQEVVVGGRTVINIGLKTDSNLLEETIVVAYGTAKKGTFTGAASVVKQDAIKDVPAASFENALNGKVAGMQITTTSGQAGSAPSILGLILIRVVLLYLILYILVKSCIALVPSCRIIVTIVGPSLCVQPYILLL